MKMIYFKKNNINRIELLKEIKHLNIKLNHCGFTFQEFKRAGYSIHDLVNHGFNIRMFEDCFNNYLNPLNECDCNNLSINGYSFKEMEEYFNKYKKK